MQAQWTAFTGKTDTISTTTPTATYGTDLANEDTTNQALSVQHQQADGSWTTTTYTALDANGNSVADGGSPTFAAAASYRVDHHRYDAKLPEPTRAERDRSDQLSTSRARLPRKLR